MSVEMFEAVIFDWDGTLANTKKIIVMAFQRALNEIDCKISNSFIERLIGIGSIETFREILKFKNVRFDKSLLEFLVRKKVQFSIELNGDITLFAGSRELLESLEGRVKMGLASMNNRDFIDFMLRKFDLSNIFDSVITANEIINAKPHPEIFQKCAKQLYVIPEKCVVFEDSVFGIQAAKQARMSCIAVLTGVYNTNEVKNKFPDIVVNSLEEKQKILNFIFHL
ncbi:MAG: HAD family phosphatase [Candidatus Lokiarchaeota archaeon]|nr:HAD family phosphatase [Candidatus Bathyarchaeota archaeon]MBY9013497.1 HAD family phosphatase [Candidatus Lokiarchaeota archaeon]